MMIHKKYKTGDKMFVDYTADKLSYSDRDKGKPIAIETFGHYLERAV